MKVSSRIAKGFFFLTFIPVFILLFRSTEKTDRQFQGIKDIVERACYGSGGHVRNYKLTLDPKGSLYIGWIEIITKENGSTVEGVFLRKISPQNKLLFDNKIAESVIITFHNIDVFFNDFENNIYLFWSETAQIDGLWHENVLMFAKVDTEGNIIIPKTNLKGKSIYRSVTQDNEGNTHVLSSPWRGAMYYTKITPGEQVESKKIRTEGFQLDWNNKDIFSVVSTTDNKLVVFYKPVYGDYSVDPPRPVESQTTLKYFFIDADKGEIAGVQELNIKEAAYQKIPNVTLPRLDVIKLPDQTFVVNVGVTEENGSPSIYQIKFTQRGEVIRAGKMLIEKAISFEKATPLVKRRIQTLIGEKGKLKELFLYGLDEKGRFYYEKKSF